MAETVLSMARSMLGSAISKAAAAAAEEMSLLMGVQKEIWFMKDELKTMQAFLIAAEAMKKKDLLLKVWAEQVRSLSYDIEDCLDEFMAHVGRQSLFQNLMKLKDRHRIAVQIRNLKARVEEVSSRNTRYNLISMDASNAICEVDSYMEDVRNNSANNIAEAELVGFDTPKRELLDKINVNINDGHARVICVVGMGGLGKTTLVRKTYESKEDIAKNFSCCAWITVSQSFSKTELLKDMIKQLLGNRALEACLKELGGKAEDLASYLRQGLDQKRYFTVLDDLWNIHDWKWISSNAFPSNNNKGSRIIVTTRENGLAETCTSKPFIYYLKPLEEECAIDLLLRKMEKCKEDMENDKKLKNIVTKLVKKCGRLPLAILTIGALFGSTHVSEWENLFKQLPLELESNPNLEAMRRMIHIGKLQCLQALDIRNSQISTLPNEISKLQSLRSLRCSNSGYYKYFNLDEPKDCMMQTLCIPTIFMPLVDSGDRDIIIADLHMAFSSRWSKSRGVRVPTGFSKLKDLQILELVDIRRTSTKVIEELGELIQLRKLRVTIKGAAERKCKAFYKAIQKLSSLRSLSIDDEVRSGTGTLESLGSAFSPPPLLKNLRLSGYIGGMPEWFSSLTQLVKISLDTNKLTEGKTMELLGALPKLMILRLYMKVHVGKELVFREGAFPCLRKLEILGIEQLRGMRFEEGASPEMESIIIYICKLTSGITGIKHLPRLKEISLNGFGARVARLGTLEEEVNGHPNPTKPVLRLQVDRRFHDLGEVEGYDVQVQAIEPVPDHAQEDSQEITLTSTATEPVEPNNEDA
ncbi:unnamed protein product [Urochloa decumbens]|uniref:Uncharacterized protein n=1 Tax=Urochloa decumbens TaxID=240449 RepID=A0ABC9DFM7_9POAL